MDVSILCRSCLKLSINSTSIHDIYDEKNDLIDILEYIIGDVEELFVIDGYDRICVDCERQLIASYEFKKQYIKSNRNLYAICKNSIEKNNTETKLVSHDDEVDNHECGGFNQSFCDNLSVSSDSEGDSVIEQEYDMNFIQIPEHSHDNYGLEEPSFEDSLNYIKVEIKKEEKIQGYSADVEKKYDLCDICGRYVYKLSLRTHLTNHSNSKKGITYKCKICGKIFKTRYAHSQHIDVIHNGSKRYTCEHCGQKFRYSNSKRVHIDAVHTEDRVKFPCKICNKSFTTKSSVTSHVKRTHLMELPYKCPHCDKRFPRNYTLKNHVAIHTGERNHKCEHCEKSYKTRSALQIHSAVHKEDKFMCPICKRGFSSNCSLRYHIRKNHVNYELPPPGTMVSEENLRPLSVSFTNEQAEYFVNY